MSARLAAEEDGDRLTHEEPLSAMLLLPAAGNEPARNLLGNGMPALLRHPHQRPRLSNDPGLPDAAIDDLLRYASPIQRNGRGAREDGELGDTRIGAGDVAISVIGAANRESGVFENRGALDFGRREASVLRARPSLLDCRRGASLAVLEARVAGAALPDRFASTRLPAQPRHPRGGSRGARRRAPVDRGAAHGTPERRHHRLLGRRARRQRVPADRK